MKVCILSVVELKHMVMSSLYTRYFEKNNIEYDIVYMDRYHKEEKNKANKVYRYESPNSGRLSKVFGYLFFLRYAKRVLKDNEYDFLIVWNEYTAAIFASFLSKNYPGRYCLNIRDLYNEDSLLQNPRLFNPMLKKSLSQALFATVSSGEYIKYLPQYNNYIFVHSINGNILPERRVYDESYIDKPIKILYIGKISYYDEAKQLMNSLKNDKRFIMKFVGIGSEVLKEYAESTECNNTEFIGRFESDQTTDFLKEADIIYNIYGDTRTCEKTALSNKMYYAACLNVPILVCKNTYMYDIASKCGIAFAVDEIKDSLGNELYNWYVNLDRQTIQQKCKTFINEAINSQLNLYSYLNKEFDKLQGENKND